MILIKRYKNNKMKYDFLNDKDICYVGKLLPPAQITCLKKYGNTCISEQFLKTLGKAELLRELTEITGMELVLDIAETKEDGNFILVRAVGEYPLVIQPEFIINTTKFKKYFVIYKNNEEFMKISKEQMTLFELKELLLINGVTDYEIK